MTGSGTSTATGCCMPWGHRPGVRRIDTAARYGDEFVVLLPETDPTGAYVVAEESGSGVQELELVRRRRGQSVCCRSGVVAIRATAPRRTN